MPASRLLAKVGVAPPIDFVPDTDLQVSVSFQLPEVSSTTSKLLFQLPEASSTTAEVLFQLPEVVVTTVETLSLREEESFTLSKVLFQFSKPSADAPPPPAIQVVPELSFTVFQAEKLYS